MRDIPTVRVIAIALLLAGAKPASAEHWYEGKYGKNRVTHMSITLATGFLYVSSDTIFENTFAGDTCRWCRVPGVDRAARQTLLWDDVERARTLSDVSAYYVSPAVALGLLLLSEHDTNAPRLIDDLLPVLESVAVSQFVTQIVKFGVARQRPYAHYMTDTVGSTEDNLSFWSGHSALAFAFTTSGGLIAHWRGYWTEPYIWGAGITLSVATEYLRIAGDKHYLTDVFAGGAVGIASGLLIPRFMRRELAIVPIQNGAAITGQF